MCKIVGIGANVYDTLAVLPHYAPEDTKLRAEHVQRAGGGPCATGLVAASKLGASAAFLGCVTADGQGEFLIEDFQRYGVSTGLVRKIPGFRAFTSYVMLSRESGSRTIVFDKGNLPPLALDAAQKAAIRNADILMVDGNELSAALEGCKIARESGTKVLYDAGGVYEGIEQLLPFADVLIPSEEFAAAVTGESNTDAAAEALYQRYTPEVAVITQGKKGGTLYDGAALWHYPVMDAGAVVDSNGAGDVFHGAFAFGMTRGYSYRGCCLFASAVSGLKCTKVGARAGVPDFETVIQFLKERGIDEL